MCAKDSVRPIVTFFIWRDRGASDVIDEQNPRITNMFCVCRALFAAKVRLCSSGGIALCTKYEMCVLNSLSKIAKPGDIIHGYCRKWNGRVSADRSGPLGHDSRSKWLQGLHEEGQNWRGFGEDCFTSQSLLFLQVATWNVPVACELQRDNFESNPHIPSRSNNWLRRFDLPVEAYDVAYELWMTKREPSQSFFWQGPYQINAFIIVLVSSHFASIQFNWVQQLL